NSRRCSFSRIARASILRGGRSGRDPRGCPAAEPRRPRVNAVRGGCVDGCTAALEPQFPRNPQMKHRTLFTALAIALVAAAGASAAEPATSPKRAAMPTLDANGDGVIDRAEAAKF